MQEAILGGGGSYTETTFLYWVVGQPLSSESDVLSYCVCLDFFFMLRRPARSRLLPSVRVVGSVGG